MHRHAYAPYEPLGILKPAGADIWTADGPEIRFGYLGVRLPFPTRMTLVRLPDGGLWLHSPIEPAPELVEEVRAIGPVCFLVAPNSLHYWWLPEWAQRFPGARFYAVPGLDRSAKRRLPPAEALTDAAPSGWSGTLDQALVKGDALTEVVFFHRPSRTLILTDLIENFEPARVGSWWYRLLVRLAGAADPDGKAPIDMRLSFLRERRALRQAVERMIGWAPERVILAHGRCYESNAVAELRRAFRWVL